MRIENHMPSKDCGPDPYVTNIHMAAMNNPHFRTTIWTGEYLQMTLMMIPPCGEVGQEIHPDTDQYKYFLIPGDVVVVSFFLQLFSVYAVYRDCCAN